MPTLDINLDGDKAWPELAEKLAAGQVIDYQEMIQVAVLAGGMASGKPSVTFRFNLPDGRVVLAQTSALLVLSLARAIRGRFGDIDA